ncbi:hypothetical protein PEC18_11735 [Paucibacter sp. O1-1]|nr:hypothetical protein [Paucibacter sp. O1-1]MDA3826494.1 hypothetical protein [Paucibacter sp. O1-1]
MTILTHGRRAGPAPTVGAPSHYLRRVARSIVLRAALQGRLSWPAALAMLARLETQP